MAGARRSRHPVTNAGTTEFLNAITLLGGVLDTARDIL